MTAPHPDRHATIEAGEIETLVAAGPRSRAALVRLADRGDWRTRVTAVSALGRLVRAERAAGPVTRLWHPLARIPGLRRRIPTMGPHGRLVGTSIEQATRDPAFMVRVAAALALAECIDPHRRAALMRLLSDPFRPVRLAAALGLQALRSLATTPVRLDDCEPTPRLFAEGAPTSDWLEWLSAAHAPLLAARSSVATTPEIDTAASPALWLAGPLSSPGEGGAAAEAARYDEELDLRHQMAKPFGPTGRTENLGQLAALVTLVANLDLPPGALVVDLGGGSGWVASMLDRFGFHVVVVDVALPLLRLATQRTTTDGRPLQAAAADMGALPFATQSVDAVFVLEALHHVEHIPEALREVRRVLKSGAPLLLAEPGEGHSESPKSLAESREHGIRESEIHPLTLARLARTAGFDDICVLPHLPLRARMTVDALERAMREPSERWDVSIDDEHANMATLIVRTTLSRPLMLMRAGRPAPDSRAPALLRATISPALVRRGATIEGRVTVTNGGDTLWLAETPAVAGTVQLAFQRLDPSGRLVDRDFARIPLPSPVAPGRSVIVDVPPLTADNPANLKIDLVAESVCWFEDRGSRPVALTL